MLIDNLNDEDAYFLLVMIDRNILIDIEKWDTNFDHLQLEKLTGTDEFHIDIRCPYCMYHNPKENQLKGKRKCDSCKIRKICKYYDYLHGENDRKLTLQYMRYLRAKYESKLIKLVRENGNHG